MHLLLHNILLLTLLTNLRPDLPSIQVSVKYSCFSCNSLTCFFEIFHNNITSIECFLVVLIRNFWLKSFVYDILFRSQSLLRSKMSCKKYGTMSVTYHLGLTFLCQCFIFSKLVYLLQLYSFCKTLKSTEGSENILTYISSFTTSSAITLRNMLMSFSSNHFIVALK